jgi:hypothetical protein
MSKYSDQIDAMKPGDSLQEQFGKGTTAAEEMASGMAESVQSLMASGMSMEEAMAHMAKSTDFKLVEVSDASEADVVVPYSEI